MGLLRNKAAAAFPPLFEAAIIWSSSYRTSSGVNGRGSVVALGCSYTESRDLKSDIELFSRTPVSN